MSHHFLSEVKRLEHPPHQSPHGNSEASGDRPDQMDAPLDASPVIDVQYTTAPESPSDAEAVSDAEAASGLEVSSSNAATASLDAPTDASTEDTLPSQADVVSTPEGVSGTGIDSVDVNSIDVNSEDIDSNDANSEDANEDASSEGTNLEPDSDPLDKADGAPDSERVTVPEPTVALSSSVDADDDAHASVRAFEAPYADAFHADTPRTDDQSAASDPSDTEPVAVTVVSEAISQGQRNDDDETDRLTPVNEELAAALQREEGLSARIRDLERQLSAERKQVEDLRLDLEIVKASKKELLADLAEAKRYILHLTTPPSSPSQHARTASHAQTASAKQPSPASVSRTKATKKESGRSPQSPSQQAHRRKPLPSRYPQPSPAAASRSQGLPSMSTEQLQGLPPMSSERVAASNPAPSQPADVAKAPSRPALSRPASPQSPRPASRQPLMLPDRNPRPSTSSSSSEPSSTKQPPKEPTPKKSSNVPPNASKDKGSGLSTLRRSPLRPMSHGERPIPESARDTHKKVPEPKLSNSEISWFD